MPVAVYGTTFRNRHLKFMASRPQGRRLLLSAKESLLPATCLILPRVRGPHATPSHAGEPGCIDVCFGSTGYSRQPSPALPQGTSQSTLRSEVRSLAGAWQYRALPDTTGPSRQGRWRAQSRLDCPWEIYRSHMPCIPMDDLSLGLGPVSCYHPGDRPGPGLQAAERPHGPVLGRPLNNSSTIGAGAGTIVGKFS